MKKFIYLFSSFLFAFLQANIFPTRPASSIEYNCKDIGVVFADGSGATIDGTNNDYLDFKEAVSGVLDRTGLKYDFYELGSEAQGPYRYPATGIGIESFKNFVTTVGAVVSAGKSYTYGESFRQGKNELKIYLRKELAKCPNKKFILSGFSQGAGVMTMGMPEYTEFKDNIIYIATFGDAKLYLPEGSGVLPPACRGENLSDYREYVPDCLTNNGILQGEVPYVAEGFEGKVGAWCNHYDMICTSRINWLNLNESMNPHGSYGNDRDANRTYYMASETIYLKVLDAFGLEKPEKEKKKTFHNTAILIDTTGSMKNLINQYKKEALRLAKNIYSTGGKVALYEYRDLQEDNFEPILHCDFETCDIEKIEEILDNLETDGGGDDPESLLSVSLQAMNELKWEQGAVKSIIALTDAGYHETEIVGGKEIGIEEVKLRSLEIDPVNIYTITPEYIQNYYTELTTGTGGKSFSSTGELTFSSEYIFNRPDVKLTREEYTGMVGEEFRFDAEETTADSKIVKYEWDLDFDGVFETETDVPFVLKSYATTGSGFIQVRATDENGLFGTMSAKVNILEGVPEAKTELKIIDAKKDDNNGKVEINFTTNGEKVLVYNNNILIGVTGGTKVTITDLDFSVKNKITLIPYGGEVSSAGNGDSVMFAKNDSGNSSKPEDGSEDDSDLKDEPENSFDSGDDSDDNSGSEKDEKSSSEKNGESKNAEGRKTDNDKTFNPDKLKTPDCGIVKKY